ncbi:MAG: class I SAM-dependent methyltransferase [Phycisphaerales bacterium]|nr:class I SAM-dependent methyltransferase [Phycisphaerales bacterium]
MEIKNTHANKAESYDIGRPSYPQAFFDYVYDELGLTQNAIIADVGAGTGKITKSFLERGSSVFAVEPDPDMMKILKKKLTPYTHCTLIENAAENTEIPPNSIDFIFCGNAYNWFDRNRVIPEFKRIIKNDTRRTNIMVATLGPDHDVREVYADAFLEINKKFIKPNPNRKPNISPPFKSDTFVTKTFPCVISESFNQFLHGALSASHTPTPQDRCFDEYCESVKRLFEKYSDHGTIEAHLKLWCITGNVENLVY